MLATRNKELVYAWSSEQALVSRRQLLSHLCAQWVLGLNGIDRAEDDKDKQREPRRVRTSD